jgi:hypothetical protein
MRRTRRSTAWFSASYSSRGFVALTRALTTARHRSDIEAVTDVQESHTALSEKYAMRDDDGNKVYQQRIKDMQSSE